LKKLEFNFENTFPSMHCAPYSILNNDMSSGERERIYRASTYILLNHQPTDSIFESPTTCERIELCNAPEPEEDSGAASVFSTSVNLFNSIVGASMIGLPYGMANCGIILGVVFIILGGIGEAFVIHLLGKCVLKEAAYSFQKLARKTQG